MINCFKKFYHNRFVSSFLLLLICHPMHVHAQHKESATQNKLSFLSPGLGGKFSDVNPVIIPIKDALELKWNSKESPLQTSGASEISCPYINNNQNSLSPNSVNGSSFGIKWQTALNPDYESRYIIAKGDRIIIEATFWQLYNLDGKMLIQDKIGMSHVVMNDVAKSFYYVNAGGELVARHYEDGKFKFATLLPDADEYVRPVILFNNNIFTISGIERELDPHGHHKPSKSSVTNIDATKLLKNDYNANNDFAKRLGTLYIPSQKSVVAGSGKSLSVAYPDNILLVNNELKVTAQLTGHFSPVSISRDEAGNIVLLNDNDEGRSIWLITENGERIFSSAVNDAIIFPPIVGSHHRLFVPCKKGIFVIENDGKQHLNYVIKNAFKGATATADDKLLVSDGNELVLFEKNGESKLLFDFGNEQILTSPVITNGGDILVATKRFLYCLTAK